MNFEVAELEVLGSYIVYEAETGAIVFVHSPVGQKGDSVETAQSETDALNFAAWKGHNVAQLRVLRVENFEGGAPQKVDVKTMTLGPATR